MNIEQMSDQKLLSVHSIIKKALKADDSLPEGEEKFAVRRLPGWRTLLSCIENELGRRQIEFVMIRWWR